MDAVDWRKPDDPSGAAGALLLSLLGVLREQVRRRVFTPRQRRRIERITRAESGWRPARLRQLLRLFLGRANPERAGRASRSMTS